MITTSDTPCAIVSASTPIISATGTLSTVVESFRTVVASAFAATPEIKTRLFEDAVPLYVEKCDAASVAKTDSHSSHKMSTAEQHDKPNIKKESDIIRIEDYCHISSEKPTSNRDLPSLTTAVLSPVSTHSPATTTVASTTTVTSLVNTTTPPSAIQFDNASLQPTNSHQPVDNITTDNGGDVTTTKEYAVNEDIRYLFSAIGTLTEQSKETHKYSQQIPELIKELKSFKTEVKTEIADLSARVLIVEEEMNQLKSFMYTKDGQNIVMLSKSRISSLEEKAKAMDISVRSLLNQQQDLSDTIAYAGWDETRVLKIEDQLANLEKQNQLLIQQMTSSQPSDLQQQHQQRQKQQQQQQHLNHQQQQQKQQQQRRDNNNNDEYASLDENDSPGNDNNNGRRKKRIPCTYNDVKVGAHTLLLTDSNGSWIEAKRFVPNNKDVQRVTCYTLNDVETFTKEATIEKEPTKILLQVGTNTLTHIKSADNVHIKMKETVSLLSAIYPNARIYISALLPRNDGLHKTAMNINELLEDWCDSIKRVTFISHSNIPKAEIYDRLHLDVHGFYKFLWNFRYGMFGLIPPSSKKRNNGYRYRR